MSKLLTFISISFPGCVSNQRSPVREAPCRINLSKPVQDRVSLIQQITTPKSVRVKTFSTFKIKSISLISLIFFCLGKYGRWLGLRLYIANQIFLFILFISPSVSSVPKESKPLGDQYTWAGCSFNSPEGRLASPQWWPTSAGVSMLCFTPAHIQATLWHWWQGSSRVRATRG